MKQAELITNKNGRCLVCWYSGDRYDQAIAEAKQLHSVAGDPTVAVICLPVGFGYVFNRLGGGIIFLKGGAG